MKSPVSVIIPAFNCAATLVRAVESAINQTTPPAEIIMVDDASTDGTWQEIRRLQATYAGAGLVGIRLDTNRGPGDARNRGWDAASQEFIAFLDADDAWHPRKLEIQYQWMQEHSRVMLSGHRSLVMQQEPAAAPQLGETRVTWFELGSLLLGNPFSTPTIMLKRSIPERFTPEKRYSEDYLLWLKVVSQHGRAACIELPLNFLFKARYGQGGLSARMWSMEKGEIDTYRECWRGGILSFPGFMALSAFSLMKFMRRLLLATS